MPSTPNKGCSLSDILQRHPKKYTHFEINNNDKINRSTFQKRIIQVCTKKKSLSTVALCQLCIAVKF